MASRHCGECGEFWPGHHMNCPVCAKPCQVSSQPTMGEDEYRWLLYTKKGRVVAVPKREGELVQAEWDAMEAEVVRRGGRWTVVDLMEEGFSVRPVA